jgi:hypothetical protein
MRTATSQVFRPITTVSMVFQKSFMTAAASSPHKSQSTE